LLPSFSLDPHSMTQTTKLKDDEIWAVGEGL